MKKLTEQQWGDVRPDIINRNCAICGKPLVYSEPNYTEMGNLNVMTLSCVHCGHIEFYNVDELILIANAKNEAYIKDGQRKRQ